MAGKWAEQTPVRCFSLPAAGVRSAHLCSAQAGAKKSRARAMAHAAAPPPPCCCSRAGSPGSPAAATLLDGRGLPAPRIAAARGGDEPARLPAAAPWRGGGLGVDGRGRTGSVVTVHPPTTWILRPQDMLLKNIQSTLKLHSSIIQTAFKNTQKHFERIQNAFQQHQYYNMCIYIYMNIHMLEACCGVMLIIHASLS